LGYIRPSDCYMAQGHTDCNRKIAACPDVRNIAIINKFLVKKRLKIQLLIHHPVLVSPMLVKQQ